MNVEKKSWHGQEIAAYSSASANLHRIEPWLDYRAESRFGGIARLSVEARSRY